MKIDEARKPYKVGETVWYNQKKAKITKIAKGPDGPWVFLKFPGGLEIRTTPGLDPSWGAKTRADVNKGHSQLTKALHGEDVEFRAPMKHALSMRGLIENLRSLVEESDELNGLDEPDELDEMLAGLDSDDLSWLDELNEDELFDFFVESEILEAGCGPGQKMVFGRCANVSKGGIKRKVAGAAKAAAVNKKPKWHAADPSAQSGKAQSMRNPKERKARIAAVKDAIKTYGHRGARVTDKEQAALDRDAKRKPGGRTRGGQDSPLPDRKAAKKASRVRAAKRKVSKMTPAQKKLAAKYSKRKKRGW